ncbi:MAG TPA: helix-turn-helix transcriptional regulator [Syntrophomonadaceae bacterium]|nr:helix-turn-helix transcriptional regulator [Syntrophomonadaceae bacterium]
MLGERIRNLRKMKGMSQKDLAHELSKKLGRIISQDSVGTYERGSRGVPPDILAALADILNCSVDYLVGRSDLDIDLEKDAFTTAIAAMFRAQKTLSPEEKRRLISVLKAGWPDLFNNKD